MLILVCFALKEEAAPFHKVAAQYPGTITLIVGIGRQNADRAIRDFLAKNSPDLVFTCGFAGGLNPELKVGDVVFEIPAGSPGKDAEVPNQFEPPDVGCYEELVAAGAKPVKFYCADCIATTVAEKKALRHQTGADAVEMESEAIQAVCAEKGIPCVTLRVISDPADEDLPLDFNDLAKPDKSLDFGKLAWAIAKSPGKIPQLMALQKKTKFAAERLAQTLSQAL